MLITSNTVSLFRQVASNQLSPTKVQKAREREYNFKNQGKQFKSPFLTILHIGAEGQDQSNHQRAVGSEFSVNVLQKSLGRVTAVQEIETSDDVILCVSRFLHPTPDVEHSEMRSMTWVHERQS